MEESTDEIKKHLQELEGWELKEGKIVKNYGFKSFMHGVKFVNDVARIAVEQNHQPVITIVWKTVEISSISFDVGEITDRDFELAKAVDELYSKKFEEKISIDDDFTDDEHRMMMEEEEKDKARKRTRGPYRKSSKVPGS
ncbi:MAG: 4a-hydroxytetrahydrobiopterin dehydratase [Nitrososphaerales archaeon]